MANLKLISEDFFTQVFEDYFKGIPVRLIRNKFTGEVKINAEDMAKCLGFDSLNDLLSADVGLDAINEQRKKNPDMPIFGDFGSGAMFEKTNFFH